MVSLLLYNMHGNIFDDRTEAGRQLAVRLARYRNTQTVVLALPRGGVVLGKVVSEDLSLPLDIVVTRKIGHPFSDEFAIGAIDSEGRSLIDQVEVSDVDKKWLQAAMKREQAEAKRREQLYRGGRPKVPLAGKTVIVVDDGIATGMTMKLAIKNIKATKPKYIVVAVPVAPADSVGDLMESVDEVIVIVPPQQFAGAVGAHYRKFPPVNDQSVIKLLQVSSSQIKQGE